MLAILTTHPIQYQVPLWQALAREGSIPFEVWYLSDHATRKSLDEGFGKSFAWDLDLLLGYPYRFLNVNRNAEVGRFTGLRLQESLRNLFSEKEVTALWIQGWQVMAYWQAVWQAHASGVPVWVRGESNDLGTISVLKTATKRLLLGQLFLRIQQFLYIGQANRRFYEKFGIRPEQLHSAPYCVDNDRFAQQATELRPHRSEIRRGWGIPEDSFCILFAGKFVPKKRPMDLVKAVSNLQAKANSKRIHLLFSGSGELRNELHNACQVIYDGEVDLKKVYHGSNGHRYLPPASFAGFLNQKEVSRAYVAADCLVLPSDAGETWGLVVNEALASGLPCVVSDKCGCSEDLVAPIDPGYRFRCGDTDGLASSLIHAIEQPPSPSELHNQIDRFGLAASIETICRRYAAAAGI